MRLLARSEDRYTASIARRGRFWMGCCSVGLAGFGKTSRHGAPNRSRRPCSRGRLAPRAGRKARGLNSDIAPPLRWGTEDSQALGDFGCERLSPNRTTSRAGSPDSRSRRPAPSIRLVPAHRCSLRTSVVDGAGSDRGRAQAPIEMMRVAAGRADRQAVADCRAFAQASEAGGCTRNSSSATSTSRNVEPDQLRIGLASQRRRRRSGA